MARLALSSRLRNRVIVAALVAVGLAMVLPLAAQTSPPRTTAARATSPTRTPTRGTASATPSTPTRGGTSGRTATPTLPTPAPKTHPFLPPPIVIDNFFADLSLSPKAPGVVPAGYEPLCTAAEWQAFRDKYGTEMDGLTKLKTSGQIAVAEKLIAAATSPEGILLPMGERRLLLVRAAAIAYRSKEGFPTADKAVTAYVPLMDKKSPAQVGALWSVANIMSRTSVTPKPDRIRYDGIAAKANMQLALLMLQADQIEAAQAITKQVAYHEGWLKSDPATRALITQVRSEVRQTAAMMEYLVTQYQPAIHNDVTALTTVYLYGRYVKNNLAIVADLPGRVPESHLAQLAASLDAASSATGGRGNMNALFTAAENLRMLAAGVTDGRIRSRTLYAAMQLYDAFLASPLTERSRVERTLARIAREGVVSDGARKGFAVDVFAPPAPASAPTPEAPAHRTAPVAPVRVALLGEN